MHTAFLVSARAARLPVLLLALLLNGAASAEPPAKDILRSDDPADTQVGVPRGVEVIPPTSPGAEERAKSKNVPYSERMQVKDPKTGKITYLYKCGEEFTDNPACTAPVKPSTMRPTTEELARCKSFKGNNFQPWYCR